MAVIGKLFTAAGKLFGSTAGVAKRAAGRAVATAHRVLQRQVPSGLKPLPPGERSATLPKFGSGIPLFEKTWKSREYIPAPDPVQTTKVYSSQVERFLDGLTVDVESDHVKWLQYEESAQTLYICFHGGDSNNRSLNAVYQYLDIDAAYAEKVFNNGDHTGTRVWDMLRERGTVFGWQKPYSLIAASNATFRVNFGGYHPKYLQTPEWEAQHANIPKSGAVPESWQDRSGNGPYDPDWLDKFNQPLSGAAAKARRDRMKEKSRERQAKEQDASGVRPGPWWYG